MALETGLPLVSSRRMALPNGNALSELSTCDRSPTMRMVIHRGTRKCCASQSTSLLVTVLKPGQFHGEMIVGQLVGYQVGKLGCDIGDRFEAVDPFRHHFRGVAGLPWRRRKNRGIGPGNHRPNRLSSSAVILSGTTSPTTTSEALSGT